MSKRTLWCGIALLIVVALAVLAVGCGSEETTTTTAATPTTSGPVTTMAPGTETTATSAATETTLGQPVKLYVGGTFALTGAYAEDCAAVLAGFQDYVAWVNDNHMLAPWATDKTHPGQPLLRAPLGRRRSGPGQDPHHLRRPEVQRPSGRARERLS